MLAALASAATVHCLATRIGPGALRSATSGAQCLLAEYRNQCHPADYVLAAYGVDTALRERFELVVRDRRCRILVTETAQVFPQQPHLVGTRVCARLRAIGRDVVADRCTPPATVSLTNLR